MIVLAVIVGFPLFRPPRRNGFYSFREDPLDIRQYLAKGPVFFAFHENHRKSSTMYLFPICSPPWQETFADAGDGDGGRGAIWNHFRFILNPFWIHVTTIL